MPPGRDDEGVGGEHELVQPREERAMLERLLDERVDVLLEGQVDADADRLRASRRAGGAFVGGLHQPGAAAGDDVAAHLGERRGHTLGFLVARTSRADPSRAEDGHAIALAPRRRQPREVVDDVPEPEHRLGDGLPHLMFVAETDRVGPSTQWLRCVHTGIS